MAQTQSGPNASGTALQPATACRLLSAGSDFTPAICTLWRVAVAAHGAQTGHLRLGFQVSHRQVGTALARAPAFQ